MFDVVGKMKTITRLECCCIGWCHLTKLILYATHTRHVLPVNPLTITLLEQPFHLLDDGGVRYSGTNGFFFPECDIEYCVALLTGYVNRQCERLIQPN